MISKFEAAKQEERRKMCGSIKDVVSIVLCFVFFFFYKSLYTKQTLRRLIVRFTLYMEQDKLCLCNATAIS